MSLFPLTETTLRNKPEAVSAALFGPGGLLAQVIGDSYRHNPTQVEYAGLLMRATVRGLNPEQRGRVTFIEASTATGKTLAYVTVGLLVALLTGRRFLVSTFTRTLMFQVVGQEAETARKLAGLALGFEGDRYGNRQVKVAPRRSRKTFVSPSRGRAYAEELRALGRIPAAEAIEAYVAMTEDAAMQIRDGGGAALVESLGGLVETFEAERPDVAETMAALPPDRYWLTSLCPEDEQVVWMAYRDAANAAVGLAVTHALFLTDMSLHGRLTEANEQGFALAVIDEAHALERAADSVFSTKRSIVELARHAAVLRMWIECDGSVEEGPREELVEATGEYGSRAQDLVDLLKEAVRANGAAPYFVIRGDEPWLATLETVRASMRRVIGLLGAAGRRHHKEAARELVERDDEIGYILKAVDFRRKTGKSGLFVPIVSLTPVREDPSLQIMAVQGQRIASRMWERGKDGTREPMADAVLFTSATLGKPGRSGWEAFEGIAWRFGIGKERAEVNADLCATLETRDFGRPSFRWADPRAPYMTGGPVLGEITEAGAAYVAHAIATASASPSARGTCRIMVLSKNFADPARIFEALSPDLQVRTVLRTRDMPLRKALAAWRERTDAILLTCGAFEGVNEKGLVDHLVIPRLPFDPPPDLPDARQNFGASIYEMLTTLRQALGRAVRQADDAPCIWMLDPRVPPPEAVQARERVFPDKASARATYLSAFPRDWGRAMGRGKVLRCPDAIRRGADAPAPKPEEEDA